MSIQSVLSDHERAGVGVGGSHGKAAFSIDEFCISHGISRAMFYKMQKAGTAPRVMKVGRRTLISGEAAADWRRALEAA